jgi:hypothetical protein
VCRAGSEDVLPWNFRKNGVFSVRSAYHLAVNQKNLARGRAESSRSSDNHKGRLWIWDGNTPNKMKVHFWRLVENDLAVGTELHRRKVKGGIVCLACGREESLVHRFWKCPHSVSAWQYLKDHIKEDLEAPLKLLRCHAELKSWLLDWIGKSKEDQATWMLTMFYIICGR